MNLWGYNMVEKKFNVKMPGGDSVTRLVEEVAKPAEEKKEVTPAVKEVKTKTKRNTKKATKETDDFSEIFEPKKEKELRNVAVNLRVKKSVKENFDLICARLGRSQSDMLEFWVDLTMKKITIKYKD